MKKKVSADKVTLFWDCPECNESQKGLLTDIIEVGVPICPGCGDDMELQEFVEIENY